MLKKSLFIYRLGILFFGLWGLSYLLPNELYKLTFYTNLSNILVVGFYGYLVFGLKNQINSSFIYRLKAGVTICITLTFLVYALLLAPIAEPQDFYHIKNYTLHYIVPIMTIIDWFFFDEKGAYQLLDPIKWTILPLLYCVYSLIRGYIFRIPIPNEKNSPYPYFFLNIDKYGWNGFFIYFIAILTGYMIIGYVMYAVKRKKK